jgi:hypothetical protein
MWTLALLSTLVIGDAHARSPRTVIVRPLPPLERAAVVGPPTKEQLIAASFVDYTVTHTPLGRVEQESGGLLGFPAIFTCVVAANQLTVSYTREGIDAAALPRVGACGTGKEAIRFRIRVEAPDTEA